MFIHSVYACFIGFFLDIIFGDPHFLYHPIRLIGKLIEVLETFFRRIFPDSEKGFLMAGIFFSITVCIIVTGVVFIIIYTAYRLNVYFGVLFEGIICYFMIAAKSLKTESMKVYKKISDGDIEGGRKAVSMIVGRDTKCLDEKGIIKAAVETVAENLSDGVIAPLLYMIIGGGTLGALYKAINTMDSMVGYKNDRYIFFGRFPARLDDTVNFIPSRISAFIMIFAGFILHMDYKRAFVIFKRDRFNHASPNSAQTEAVCAGVLGIRLSGDAYYFGKLYKKPFIGDDINDITPRNIIDINRLMYVSSFIALFIFVGVAVFAHIFMGGGLF